MSRVCLRGGATIVWWRPDTAEKFKIQYLLSGGETMKTLAKDFQECALDWNIPVMKKNKKNVMLRVTGYDAFGNMICADSNYYYLTTEVVNLETPNGGERFSWGNQKDVTCGRPMLPRERLRERC